MSQVMAAMQSSFRPREVSFPLPKNPHVVLHAHLSFLGDCAMVHLTTTILGETAGSVAPLGSFVYAMPDRLTPRTAISTVLNGAGPSIDQALRLSKVLAIRMGQPVYVGCSMNFAGASMEEELEGFTKIVDTILTAFDGR